MPQFFKGHSPDLRLIANNPVLALGSPPLFSPLMARTAPGNPDSHQARAEPSLTLPQFHAVRVCVGQKLTAWLRCSRRDIWTPPSCGIGFFRRLYRLSNLDRQFCQCRVRRGGTHHPGEGTREYYRPVSIGNVTKNARPDADLT